MLGDFVDFMNGLIGSIMREKYHKYVGMLANTMKVKLMPKCFTFIFMFGFKNL